MRGQKSSNLVARRGQYDGNMLFSCSSAVPGMVDHCVHRFWLRVYDTFVLVLVEVLRCPRIGVDPSFDFIQQGLVACDWVHACVDIMPTLFVFRSRGSTGPIRGSSNIYIYIFVTEGSFVRVAESQVSRESPSHGICGHLSLGIPSQCDGVIFGHNKAPRRAYGTLRKCRGPWSVRRRR